MITLIGVGCSKEDPCADLFCVNGECIDGKCECEGNYQGIECTIEKTPTSIVMEAAQLAFYPNSNANMDMELWVQGKDGISNVILKTRHAANDLSTDFEQEFEISNNQPEIFLVGITDNIDTFLLNTYDNQNTLYEQESEFPPFIVLKDGDGRLLLAVKEYRF